MFEKYYGAKELAEMFCAVKSFLRKRIKIGEKCKQSLIARIHTDHFSVGHNKNIISDSRKNHRVATLCKTFHKSGI